jgi:hypothetical protein
MVVVITMLQKLQLNLIVVIQKMVQRSALSYITGDDLAQGTGFQGIADGVGSSADESAVGTLNLFNPSSTTFVKAFYIKF